MRTDIASIIAPSGGHERGGDFIVVAQHGQRTTLVVADTSGHGEEAAAPAASVKALFERHVHDVQDPCALLEAVNADVLRLDHDTFTTAAAVVVDLEHERVSWAYAGHVPPHRLSTGVPLDGVHPGVPLGVRDHVGCDTGSERARSGDGLLLYTDGLEDVVGATGERFGAARIGRHLIDRPEHPVEEIVTSLKRAACAFGREELPDDLCILAVRLVPA